MMTAMQFSSLPVACPVCNTAVSFASAETNVRICAVCNTAMERSEARGPAKVLSLKVAPKDRFAVLQIGSTGVYNKRAFEIIGCVHCDVGSYNMRRWTIVWPDGSTGLLVESLGFYAMYEKILSDFPSKLQTVQHTPVGVEIVELLVGKPFIVFDKGQCKRVSLEGEVLMTDADGVFSVIELGQLNGERLELNELTKGVFELFSVKYIGLHELSLSNITKPASVNMSCDHCSQTILIRVPQDSKFCTCSNCNGQHEILDNGRLKYLKDNNLKHVFALPVGSKGVINSNNYEVIGATMKQESGSQDIYWREYTLYDPITGYAFLSEYNGHWTFLKEIKISCAWPKFKTELRFDNENFVLFNDYSFKIKASAGEFFANFDTSQVMAREYISPPEMYLAENDDNKSVTWYKAGHISNTEIFEGLGLVDKTMPAMHGTGPLQPMKYSMNLGLLARMCGIIGLIFLGVQIFFDNSSKKATLYEQSFDLPDTVMSKGITSPSFRLEQQRSNVEIQLSAAVDNSWFSASVTLVNEATGTEYNFEKGVEYYHGYTDGENWTEGSQVEDEMLSSIPAGNYHLNIFPSFETGKTQPGFTIKVFNDVPMWRNFFIVLGFLSIFPIVSWWRTQTYERRRWNNSAYNPYSKNTDE